MASGTTRTRRRRGSSEIREEPTEEEEGGLAGLDPEDVPVISAVEPVSGRRPGYGEYEIDIEDILRQTLPGAFAKVESAPLLEPVIDQIPQGSKGAYLLFHGEDLVYAGKTDTRHGFRERLRRHSKSVQHRVGLDPERMTFKALRIMVFSAFDVEAILITEMRRLNGSSLAWNDSGFGSNDPGRKRDDGKPGDFDRWFRVDVDLPVDGVAPGMTTIGGLLSAACKAVPYKFRYGRLLEHVDRPVLLPEAQHSMRSLVNLAMDALPTEFQTTIFHGRVILYRETTQYEHAVEIIRGRA